MIELLSGQELLFLLVVFLGGIVSSVFGFGGAIVIISFGSFLFSLKETVALVSIYFLASTWSKFFIFRKFIDWKLAKLILIVSVPFTILGAFFLVVIPTQILEYLLAAIILSYLANERLGFTKNKKAGKKTIITISALSGFFSGVMGTGGTVKAILLNYLGIRKEKFVAIMAASALLNNIIKAPIYFYSGLIKADMELIIALIIVAIIAAYIGRKLVSIFKPELYKNAVDLLLLVSVVKLLFF